MYKLRETNTGENSEEHKMSQQLTFKGVLSACAAIGCTACAGNVDCTSVQAWLVKPDRDLLDLYFPRAWVVQPVSRDSIEEVKAGVAAAHDRLAAGGYEAGQEREAAKKRRYSRKPSWVN